MEEAQAAALARYRVDDGNGGHYARVMDKEQVIGRRMYMRNILRVSSLWYMMSNDQLDHMRLYKMGEDFVVEDTENRDYILKIDRRG